MASENIYMSTTSTIPNFPNKMVTKSEVTWVQSTKLMSAYNYLEKWLKERDYDAIVGVQFSMCAKPDGDIEYVISGTAVTWEY
jgi:hypothetical protein